MIYKKTDGTLGQDTTYEYDALDRLERATITPASGSTVLARYDYSPAGFKLDGAGNVVKRIITGSQVPNSITDYAYNSFNELCARQAGTSSSTPPACPTTSPAYTYDRNGNQLTAPGRTASYNLLDQTTNISGTALIYLGSGQDRWITEGTGSFQHNVLGVGRRTVGTSTDAFTRDDAGKLVSRRNGSTRHYYLFDALGSVTGLTDSTGAVTQRHDYEPYGTPRPTAPGSGAPRPVPPTSPKASSLRRRLPLGRRALPPTASATTTGATCGARSQTRSTGPATLREGNRYVYAAADPANLSGRKASARSPRELTRGSARASRLAQRSASRWAALWGARPDEASGEALSGQRPEVRWDQLLGPLSVPLSAPAGSTTTSRRAVNTPASTVTKPSLRGALTCLAYALAMAAVFYSTAESLWDTIGAIIVLVAGIALVVVSSV